MWVRPVDIEQIFEQLGRVFEAPVFQFVLLQVLPQSEVQSDLKYFIKKNFPDRPVDRINLRKVNYSQMMQQFDEANGGFMFLENFEYLLQSPDLYIGFNQRRDRIASKPLIIIALVPTGIDILRLIQDRIPDFWSLRTFTREIRYHYFAEIKRYFQPRFMQPEPDSLLLEERKNNLADLQNRLARALGANDNVDASLLLFRELALACKTLGLTDDAQAYIKEGIETAQKWTSIGNQYIIAEFYLLQCRIFLEKEEKDMAFSLLQLLDETLKPLEDRDLWYEAQQIRGEWMLEYADPEAAQVFFEQLLSWAEDNLPDYRMLILQTLYSLNWMRVGEWHRAFFILDGLVKNTPANAVSFFNRHVIISAHAAAEVLRKFGDAVLILPGAGFTVQDEMPETRNAYPFFQLFLGSAWYFKGVTADFEEHFANAFRVFSARYGTEHPLTATCLFHWGQYLFFVKGPYPWENFIPQIRPDKPYHHWKTRENSGQIISNLQGALHKFEAALAVFKQHLTPLSPKIIHCQVFIAFIHLHLQNYKIALAGFERITQNESPVIQADDYLMGVCHFGLGKTYEYLKNQDASNKSYAVMLQKMLPFQRYSFFPYGEEYNALWVESPHKPTLWRRLKSFFTRWLG